ncbi:MAG: hypothetical protein HYY03_09950 [Chloroflexi bacterium]|nr:hypothetical protein [Chloroflexota bacterium]
MSCYLPHLDDILLAAGICLTKENRPRVHALIQEITGEEDCPRVWRSVRTRLVREDTWEEFVSQLRARWRQPVA